MKTRLIAAAALVLTLGLTAALDAEARRLGGGKSAGMQRQTTTAPANTPPQPSGAPGASGQAAPSAAPAAAAPAAATAAAAAAKRNWMGPVAGLAAGLGLAALASYLGFGEALANMMLIALVVMAVLAVVALVMRKRASTQGPALAGAGSAGNGGFLHRQEPASAVFRRGTSAAASQRESLIGSRLGGAGSTVAQAAALPSDFDAAAFARNAKDQFMALQAANDAGDLERLRDYLTPEMFDVVRSDVAERGAARQVTQVFGLQAQVLAVEEEQDRYVVSVRFTGSVRDQHGDIPEDLDEVWHLTKPATGMGGWVVAGIQQVADSN